MYTTHRWIVWVVSPHVDVLLFRFLLCFLHVLTNTSVMVHNCTVLKVLIGFFQVCISLVNYSVTQGALVCQCSQYKHCVVVFFHKFYFYVFYAVKTPEDAEQFYMEVKTLMDKGVSRSRALAQLGRDRKALILASPIVTLKVTRPDRYQQVLNITIS